MEWINGFLIPIVEVTIIGGILTFIGYYFWRAFDSAWSKSVKFVFKYKLLRRKYPEKTVSWIVESMDKGLTYHDTRKLLMLKMIPMKQIYETMFIYDRVEDELNKQGGQKNGGEFKRGNSKIDSKTQEFPAI